MATTCWRRCRGCSPRPTGSCCRGSAPSSSRRSLSSFGSGAVAAVALGVAAGVRGAGVGARAAVALQVAGGAGAARGAAAAAVALQVAGRAVAAAQLAVAAVALDVTAAALGARERAAALVALERAALAGAAPLRVGHRRWLAWLAGVGVGILRNGTGGTGAGLEPNGCRR